LYVGCGSGRHTLALADRFDQVAGVDRSQPLIDIARRKRSHPRIRTRSAICWPSMIPYRFDLVFSSTTLHHPADLDAALRHLGGLVGPRGHRDLNSAPARFLPLLVGSRARWHD
jgi:SAM-dependent methyltransferase